MLKLYDTKDLVPEAQRAAAVELKDGKFASERGGSRTRRGGKEGVEKERDRADKAEKAKKKAEKERDELQAREGAAKERASRKRQAPEDPDAEIAAKRGSRSSTRTSSSSRRIGS
jgi:hypothetical protein